MATKLLYLEDFDVTECDAVVEEVGETEDGRTVIALDQTCLYARGGGQDWDMGTISGGSAVFIVEEVRLDEVGVVRQIGHFKSGELVPGDMVSCSVAPERRQANTRLHSAAHLLDKAVDALGLPWVPGKGAHYPHMSFVEYEAADYVPDEQTKTELQSEINRQANNDYENKILFVPVEEMHKYCRHVPTNIPVNKPARVVLYADDFGIPCGGTHVRSVQQIGKVSITKVKAKHGIIKVSYAVQGIN